jgi:hypothetical protein
LAITSPTKSSLSTGTPRSHGRYTVYYAKKIKKVSFCLLLAYSGLIAKVSSGCGHPEVFARLTSSLAENDSKSRPIKHPTGRWNIWILHSTSDLSTSKTPKETTHLQDDFIVLFSL